MTVQRTLLSLLLIVGAGAAMFAVASMATFSDQVISTNNTLQAGTLFMSVDDDCGPGDAGTPRTSADPVPCLTTFTTSGAIDNMAPGDSETHTFNIVNEGTLPGLLSASAEVQDDPEGCFAVSLDPELDSVPLAAGANTSTTLTVELPEEAGNECQGVSSTIEVTFDLVQDTP